MRNPTNQPGRGAGGRSGFVSVWLFSSAFLGLLIGLVEAAFLWTTPRVIPLLVPDVGWVIWFLAPLVDMTLFAIVGLGLGLLASRTRHKEAFVAANAGVAITFVYLMVKWFHVEIGLHPFYPYMEVLVPLLVFAGGFVVSLILLAIVGHRLAAFANRWLDKWLKPLACGLVAATVAAVVGIGIFVIWPPTSGPAAPTVAPRRPGAPNIVFITLDTVRADHLSSYGYSRPTTPNLDRFARTGVLFENAIAASSWTLASHASMFTGLLPQQHGADWAIPLTANPRTLAEILRSQGYQTAGIVANFDYLQRGWGIAQGFESYNDNSDSLGKNLSETLIGNAIVQPVFQSAVAYNEFFREDAGRIDAQVFRWLRHRPKRPYFLFVNYFDAHEPYVTSTAFDGRFGTEPTDLIRKLHLVAQNQAPADFTSRERAELVDGYDNCLSYLDARVGKLLSFLRRMPQWQNTIVIITSDHGEEFGGHGHYIHGFDLNLGLLHVPLIIAGPGIPKDVRISDVVGTRQLFSTVLDLAGRGNTPFSGTSLARFWKPGYVPGSVDDDVVSELDPVFKNNSGHAMISLTTPELHYVAHQHGRQELYKWTADPGEQEDLADAPGEQATLQELRSRVISLASDAVGPWRGPEYLGALDSIAGPARLSLLRPQPFRPGAAGNPFRIGIAQAFFKPDESKPVRPSQAERELMQSLPYQ